MIELFCRRTKFLLYECIKGELLKRILSFSHHYVAPFNVRNKILNVRVHFCKLRIQLKKLDEFKRLVISLKRK